MPVNELGYSQKKREKKGMVQCKNISTQSLRHQNSPSYILHISQLITCHLIKLWETVEPAFISWRWWTNGGVTAREKVSCIVPHQNKGHCEMCN